MRKILFCLVEDFNSAYPDTDTQVSIRRTSKEAELMDLKYLFMRHIIRPFVVQLLEWDFPRYRRKVMREEI